MNIFKGLSHYRLQKKSSGKGIGCPFDEYYGGKVPYWRESRVGLEEFCKNYCGKLFPRAYKAQLCPCSIINRRYVKERFWKKFNESRG